MAYDASSGGEACKAACDSDEDCAGFKVTESARAHSYNSVWRYNSFTVLAVPVLAVPVLMKVAALRVLTRSPCFLGSTYAQSLGIARPCLSGMIVIFSARGNHSTSKHAVFLETQE